MELGGFSLEGRVRFLELIDFPLGSDALGFREFQGMQYRPATTRGCAGRRLFSKD